MTKRYEKKPALFIGILPSLQRNTYRIFLDGYFFMNVSFPKKTNVLSLISYLDLGRSGFSTLRAAEYFLWYGSRLAVKSE